ncbi:hypothetical protein WA538_004986 [Blastocystis sp. DL]
MTRYEINYCPAGFYCVNGGKNECGVNKYCPEGSSSPKDVPEGYIAGPEVAIETQKSLIVNCTEGYYCSGGAMMDCGVGFYCPAGSSDPIPVSDGYFVIPEGVNEMHGVSQSICPAGFYCVNGGKNECGVNKYCPEGSSSPKDVPEGYIAGPEVAIETQKSLIMNCTEGYYCSGGAMMDCGVGFYCPAGSSDPTPVSSGYFVIPEGVNEMHGVSQSICPAGFYCVNGGKNECGVNKYCPEGSSSPKDVPEGYIAGPEVAVDTQKSLIVNCTEGYYCSGGAMMDCGVGFYCPAGSSDPIPVSDGYFVIPEGVNEMHGVSQSICPAGFYCVNGGKNECGVNKYCPEGSSSPKDVPEGYIAGPEVAVETQKSLIMNCTEGYYCSGGAMMDCGVGFYCPAGSSDPTPVSSGYFVIPEGVNEMHGVSQSICPAGFYCVNGGKNECGVNKYCPEGSSSPKDVPEGYIAGPEVAVETQKSLIMNCTEGYYCSGGAMMDCGVGFYCPAGSSDPTPVSSGYFVIPEGVNEMHGVSQSICPAGFYCVNGGKNECGVNKYCPEGSSSPKDVPEGYIAGPEVAVDTQKSLIVNCTEGYYCSGGAMMDCGVGFYCPAGSSDPIPVSDGYFVIPEGVNEMHGVSQSICPAGFYCVNGGKNECGVNKYCPEGSSSPKDVPEGYIAGPEVAIETQKSLIMNCTEGYYCSGGAMMDCGVGFYCPAGSSDPIPVSDGYFVIPEGVNEMHGVSQSICPAGFYCVNGGKNECGVNKYCPEGSSSPKDVPEGYIAGPEVAIETQKSLIVNCTEGYYCSGGAMMDCGVGFYCPAGSSDPTPVSSGYFVIPEGVNEMHGVSQSICPAGFYCVNGGKNECGVNKYCPEGSSSPKDVPEGYIAGPEVAIETQKSLIVNCTEGYYCSGGAMMDCGVGFYCPAGSSDPTPVSSGYFVIPEGVNEMHGVSQSICPAGFYCVNGGKNECGVNKYCPEGSSSPKDVPEGYIAGPEVAVDTQKSLIVNCTEGYYCSGGAMMDCGVGFYCPAGSSDPIPVSDGYFVIPEGVNEMYGVSQSICPAGFYCVNGGKNECGVNKYCPEGSSSPKDVPEGYIAGPEVAVDTQKSLIVNCTEGYYCSGGAMMDCGVGFYCPAGSSDPIPVSDGYFVIPEGVNEMHGVSQSICPAGFYCVNGGKNECGVNKYCPEGSSSPKDVPEGYIAGPEVAIETQKSLIMNCTEGYYCSGGAMMDCGVGFYCPAGSSDPTPVSSGYFVIPEGVNEMHGVSQSICPAGFYCVNGGKNECGVNKYCPEGSSSPKDVPEGYIAGPEVAIETQKSLIMNCTEGYYCSGGAMMDCGVGFYCPAGSSDPTPVSSGYFVIPEGVNEMHGVSQSICPAGFYCVNGGKNECGVNKYCPEGSSSPKDVPEGYIAGPEVAIETQKSLIMNCTEGYYCSGGAMMDCGVGFYCPAGSSDPTPVSSGYFVIPEGVNEMHGVSQSICPAGFYCVNGGKNECGVNKYCPEGSSSPKDVPEGYIAGPEVAIETQKSLIVNCTEGYYCSGGAMMDCGVGFYCPAGSSDPIPVSDGYFVIPEGVNEMHGVSQSICPAGFYCVNGGKNECGVNKYCPEGSSSPKDVPEGYIAGPEVAVDTQKSLIVNCTEGYYCSGGAMMDCGVGFYCPAGSSDPIPVSDGYFVIPEGVNEMHGVSQSICPAGFYCVNGGKNECGVNKYCPEGSSSPKDVPEGYIAGPEVAVDTQKSLIVNCTEGYYCSGGAMMDCGVGFYCPAGSSDPIPVSDGYFVIPEGVNEMHGVSQSICPAGFYCVNGGKNECGVNKYCPEGSSSPKDVPEGYIAGPEVAIETQKSLIVNCTEGYYCSGGAMMDCGVGFYCPAGSSDPTPVSSGYFVIPEGVNEMHGVSQSICPAGFYCVNGGKNECGVNKYCPEGSSSPKDVPEGYIAGPEVAIETQKSLIMNCTEGYYCSGGAMMDCGVGFYCPAGSSDPTPVSSGYFVIPEGVNEMHGVSQSICPAGFYCVNGGKNECGVNKYCPEGSSSPKDVPEGYIAGPEVAIETQKSLIVNCTEGYYCSGGAMMDCGVGFYCPAGSSDPIPVSDGYFVIPEGVNEMHGVSQSICPAGFYCVNGGKNECGVNKYCPEGSSSPKDVPEGYIAGPEVAVDTQKSLIVNCTEGYYCSGGAMMDCGVGFYCPAGSSDPIPVSDGYFVIPEGVNEMHGVSQSICPAGFYCVNGGKNECGVNKYCPEGSSSPKDVPEGYIAGPEVAVDTQKSLIVNCTEGYYCSGGAMMDCGVGFYCPAGSSDPTPVSSGYFVIPEGVNEMHGVSQSICPAGFYCVNGGKNECGVNKYCPEGSSSPKDVPEGYIAGPEVAVDTQKSLIVNCTEGYYCSGGAMMDCGVGFYCPAGSSDPIPVSDGYFVIPEGVNEMYGVSQSICPAGFYCVNGGKNECGVNKYCPEGSSSPKDVPEGYIAGPEVAVDTQKSLIVNCTEGYYCSGGAMMDCGVGFYCPAGSSDPIPVSDGYFVIPEGVNEMHGVSQSICPAGFYCVNGGKNECGVNKYCPEGSSSPKDVPEGYIAGPEVAIETQKSLIVNCTEGYYCSGGAMMDCGVGFYCPAGSSDPIPVSDGYFVIPEGVNEMHGVSQSICPAGFYCVNGGKNECGVNKYCPEGSSSPKDVPEGYIAGPEVAVDTQKSLIVNCTEGYYCSGGAMMDCGVGFYCPAGSSDPTPVSSGYFVIPEGVNEMHGVSQSICPAGFYCVNGGKNECGVNKYCPEGSSSPKDVPEGYIAGPEVAIETQKSLIMNCTEGYYCSGGAMMDCGVGFYCPAGSSDPTPVSSGYFVIPEGVNEMHGVSQSICPAGFYCVNGGKNECGVNKYCPEGSSSPKDVPEGYIAGPEVAIETQKSLIVNCTEGYYCSGGAMMDCGVGFYCPAGSSDPIPVSDGYFVIPEGVNEMHGVSQSICPAGFYCVNGGKNECGVNKYCPEGSSSPKDVPEGYIAGPEVAVDTQKSLIVNCTEGYYCSGGAMMDCGVGFYCPAGSSDPIPVSDGYFVIPEGVNEMHGVSQSICPAGFYCVNGGKNECGVNKYCPEGSSSPKDVPEGYIAGPEVAVDTQKSLIVNCTEGYYCSGGAMMDCGVGFYCPAGSSDPIPVSDGYFVIPEGVNEMHGVSQSICPAGFYCVNGGKNECGVNKYCPEGSSSPKDVPEGYIAGPEVAVDTQKSLIVNCTEGYYCSGGAMMDCGVGFYCPAGSSDPIPVSDGYFVIPEGVNEMHGVSQSICPAGFYCVNGGKNECGVNKYCPEGSSSPKDVPEGYIAGPEVAVDTQKSLIVNCTEGYYCSGGAMMDCGVGFYCPAGSSDPTPVSSGYFVIPEGVNEMHGVSQSICPAGFYCVNGGKNECGVNKYCPEGSSSPKDVPEGYIAGPEVAIETQKSLIVNCTEGYYCSGGAMMDCGVGFYCPAGSSDPIPVSDGYFVIPEGVNEMHGVSQSICPAGFYCVNGGKNECGVNKYCPEGSSSPKDVPEGYIAGPEVAVDTQKSLIVNCTEGYYCSGGAMMDCGVGFYCPAGSSDPTPVSSGYFVIPEGVNEMHGVSQSICPAGFYCVNGGKNECGVNKYCPEGSSSPKDVPEGYIAGPEVAIETQKSLIMNCTEGYYCSGGAMMDCGVGFYCPAGSSDPTPVSSGYFVIPEGVNEMHGVSQSICPAGFYCVNGGKNECGVNKYCPEGSSSPKDVPEGYIAGPEVAVDTQKSLIVNCTEGYYCSGGAMMDCGVGFYCPAGSSDPIPVSDGYFVIPEGVNEMHGVSQSICPAGFYCVNGGKNECGVNKYCPEGSSSPKDVPEGYIAGPEVAIETQKSLIVNCTEGYYCSGGAMMDCGVGFYCPAGSSDPIPVSDGYFVIPEGVNEMHGNECGVNKYCPEGSSSPKDVPEGYIAGPEVAVDTQKSLIVNCTEGYYCSGGAMMDCGVGFYCPAGSSDPIPVSDGYFVIPEGVNEMHGVSQSICPAGFYCVNGGKNECGVNKYCPEGSSSPKDVPEGYIAGPEVAIETQKSLIVNCTEGYYCSGGAMMDCGVGFYCPAGSSDPIPVSDGYFVIPEGVNEMHGVSQSICPAGFYCVNGGKNECGVNKYCPEGSSSPKDVPEGYIAGPEVAIETQKSLIMNCTEGYYCSGGAMMDCGVGFYCPAGSSDPTPVSSGYFVIPEGVNEMHGVSQSICPAGFYCVNGGKNECGVNKYCPEGSSSPKDVPEGYIAGPEVAIETQKSLIMNCTEGYYCSGGAMMDCGVGFYCPAGSSDPTPVSSGYFVIPEGVNEMHGVSQSICPAGFYCVNGGKNECGVNKYCPEGSSSPKDVPEGYIAGPEVAIETQKSLIMNCTEGYYCSGGAMMDCGVGFYCPAGSSDPTPVSSGYFVIPEGVNEMHGVSQSICPAGFYCVNGGKNECGVNKYCPEGSSSPKDVPEGYIAGPEVAIETQKSLIVNCTEGYYCSGGAMMDCGVGFYCPAGSSDPIPVSDGYFVIPEGVNEMHGVSQSICPAGFYCVNGGKNECGVNKYCPEGSSSPKDVPEGYIAGPEVAVDTQKSLIVNCTEGYYCSGGAMMDCGVGFYCPAGSSDPIPVSDGYFVIPEGVNEMHGVSQSICPAGFYCVNGGKNECGVNKYCPEGSSSPKDVPEGYIAGPEVAVDTQKSLIMNCTEGYYCSGGAMMDCGVGFYCPAGSSDPTPVSSGYFVIPEGVNEMHGVSQSICPAGFYCVNGGKNECGVNKYCPEGSSSPKDVPEGYIAGP